MKLPAFYFYGLEKSDLSCVLLYASKVQLFCKKGNE